jgi:hypothetical protein
MPETHCPTPTLPLVLHELDRVPICAPGPDLPVGILCYYRIANHDADLDAFILTRASAWHRDYATLHLIDSKGRRGKLIRRVSLANVFPLLLKA